MPTITKSDLKKELDRIAPENREKAVQRLLDNGYKVVDDAPVSNQKVAPIGQPAPLLNHIPPNTPEEPKEQGFLDVINPVNWVPGVANAGVQAVGEIGKAIGNTVGFAGQVADTINPVNWLAKAMNAPGQDPAQLLTKPVSEGWNSLLTKGQEAAAKAYGKSEEDISTSGGRLTGQIASLFGGAGIGSKLAEKGLEKIPQIQKWATALAKLIGGSGEAAKVAETGVAVAKSPLGARLISALPKFAAQSVGSTEGITAATEGRMATPGELTIGAGVDLGFKGLGKLLSKISPKLYRSGIQPIGPTGERIDELAQNAMDLNLVGSRDVVKKKATQILATEGAKLGNIVGKSKKAFTRDALVNSAVDAATELEKAGDKSAAEAMMKYVEEFRSQPNKLDANTLWKIKQKAAKEILPQLRKAEISGNLTSDLSAKKNVWAEIWKNADDVLNTISPEIAKANKNYSTASAVLESIEARLKKQPGASITFADALSKIARSPAITTRAAKSLPKKLQSAFTSAPVKAFLSKLFNAGPKPPPPKEERVWNTI